MRGQFVIRRAQRRMRRRRAILRSIDHDLLMFDARAQRKRLLFHHDLHRIQHFKRIARAVPDRQNQMIARHILPAELRAGQAAVCDVQPFQLRFKAHLAAQTDDLPTDVFHHQPQSIRADVRLRLIENFLRRAHPREGFQHAAAAHVLDAGI